MPRMESRSMVLGNEGLLGDILLRVDSPTTLVRAALVSKSWYRGASHPVLLRRFRELNPPRLLGVYVSGEGIPRPEFVQVPTPQPPEPRISAANFGFGHMPDFSSIVWDCRNGRVLYEFAKGPHLTRTTTAVRTPFRGPRVHVAPPLRTPPVFPTSVCPHALLLPDDDGDDTMCYLVDVFHFTDVVAVKVFVLRSRQWSLHCYAVGTIAKKPGRILMTTLLAGGKIYMMTAAGFILGLDMSTAKFFIVDLPEGVAYEYGDDLVPCRGGDDSSALYLVHVAAVGKLSVWLRRAEGNNNAGAGEWVLKNTISVKETCADFIPQEQGPQQQADGDAPDQVGPELEDAVHDYVPAEDEFDPEDDEMELEPDGGAHIHVAGVGDNAEFVFLELGDSGVIVYLHLGSKKVEKVYQRDPGDDMDIRVHPFMTVWPPSFPALREEADEGGHQDSRVV